MNESISISLSLYIYIYIYIDIYINKYTHPNKPIDKYNICPAGMVVILW